MMIQEENGSIKSFFLPFLNEMNFWYSHLFGIYLHVTVFIGDKRKLTPFCMRQRTALLGATLSGKTKLSQLEPQGLSSNYCLASPEGLTSVRAQALHICTWLREAPPASPSITGRARPPLHYLLARERLWDSPPTAAGTQ